ncbi:DNA (cytosine-5-)-methyltransferase [Chryseobacterium sp.]|uniref:DNA cytosine methyltransferase n=1 Tax=Chryseobacterium sp. TaxID=1871047 RepID=UPI00321BE5B1
MVVFELFAGIGGFVKGLIDAGFKIKEHYYSEIDKHAIANYKYNFPNAKYIGSVTDISGRDFTGIDIITFGSPCQDFSLAGKREGMDGKRSVLILEAIRLVTELRPPVFIWENVKGAFSSNSGADFWAILKAFTNIGGYRLEWQLLNTKWFLPQNRERIYLVGHLAGRSKPGVFPIGEGNGLCDRSKKSQKKVHSNYGTALTQQARQYASWNGDFIKVKSANKEGFEIAKPGDCVNIQNFNSTTRRGRVGKGVASTLDTGCKQAVVQPNVFVEKNIRRLTEIECERLQGFPDNWTEYGNYDGTVKKIPKTQRYKMLGNAVTVRVVVEIAKRFELL